MIRRRSTARAAAAVLLLAVLTACGAPGSPASPGATGGPGTTADPGATGGSSATADPGGTGSGGAATTTSPPAGPGPSGAPAATPDPAATSGAAGDSDPATVLGSWRRAGTTGDTGVATFSQRGVSVTVACARIDGSWASAAAAPRPLFAAVFTSVTNSCPTLRAVEPSVPWVQDAASFRATARGLELLDAAGSVTASLVPVSGSPSDGVTTPPAGLGTVVTATPPPLPDGVDAATPATLVGRWEALADRPHLPTGGFKTPVGPSGQDGLAGGGTATGGASGGAADDGVAGVGREPTGASVRFAADGTWTGGDCHGGAGRWSLGTAGRLVAVRSTVAPAVGCATGSPGFDVSAGARAGLADGQLVLLATDGAVVGRFVRAA